MSPEDLSDWATVLSSGAAVLTLGVAVVALAYARRQIDANSETARETTALTAYREYLRLCFDFPEYSSSHLAAEALKVQNWNGITEKLTPKSERYLWMITILLNTCEQVLAAEPEDPEWRSALRDQLSYHEAALQHVWPLWRAHYGGPLRELIEGRALPQCSP